jgi:hypothetical protein
MIFVVGERGLGKGVSAVFVGEVGQRIGQTSRARLASTSESENFTTSENEIFKISP